jgi:hypothetical protein
MVSSHVYNQLKEENKALLTWSAERTCFHGNVVQVGMNYWVAANE